MLRVPSHVHVSPPLCLLCVDLLFSYVPASRHAAPITHPHCRQLLSLVPPPPSTTSAPSPNLQGLCPTALLPVRPFLPKGKTNFLRNFSSFPTITPATPPAVDFSCSCSYPLFCTLRVAHPCSCPCECIFCDPSEYTRHAADRVHAANRPQHAPAS